MSCLLVCFVIYTNLYLVVYDLGTALVLVYYGNLKFRFDLYFMDLLK